MSIEVCYRVAWHRKQEGTTGAECVQRLLRERLADMSERESQLEIACGLATGFPYTPQLKASACILSNVVQAAGSGV